jgi:hypothetical protein
LNDTRKKVSQTFENVVAHGNRSLRIADLKRGGFIQGESLVVCMDGYAFSAIAGQGTYCVPRPAICLDENCPHSPNGLTDHVSCDWAGPYSAVEIGFPTSRPEPWSEWEEYWDGGDIYSGVPVDLVRNLIEEHGGE